MLRWLWLSIAVLVADQLTKALALASLRPYELRPVVDGWLNLTLAFNTGAAFSFLSEAGGWQRWLFAGLAAVVCVLLTVWLARLERGERAAAAGLALVIGGAMGNLVDRLRLGYVVDYLDFYHPALAGWPGFSADGHWPAFNVADSAITLGVVVLLAGGLRRPNQRD